MPHPTVQILQEFLHQQALPKSAVKPVAGKTQSAVYPKSILEEVVELTTDIAQLKFESVEPKENHFEILSKFLSTHEEVESIPVLLELYKHQFIQKHVKQRLIRCFTLLVDDMKQIYIAMLEKIDDAEFRQILEEIQEAYVSKRLRVNRTLTGDLKMSVTQFGQWVTDEKRLFAQLFTIDIYYTYLIEQLTLRLNSRCYPIITSQTSPQVLSDYCHFLKTNSFASSLLANAQEQLAARAEKVVAQILSFKPKGQEMLIFTRKMELPKPNTLIVDRGSGEFYPTCSSSVTLLQNLYEALPVSLPYSKYIAARASNRSGNASKFAVIQSRIDAQLFLIKNLVFLCEKISFYKTNFQAVLRTPSIPSFMTPLTPFMTPLTPFLPASLSSVPYSKDARTMLEADLKQVCETFILESSKQVMDPLSSFVVKAQCVKYGKLGDQNFGMPAVVQSVYSVFMESQLSILKSILEKLASYIGDIQTRSLLERKIGDRVQRTYVQFYELLAESKEYDFAMASPDELDKLIANMMGH